jgi:vacuolar-type H+-ATPase subunit H
MSRSSNTDEAVQRVKDAFDSASDEAGEFSEKARQEFDEAIDELEARIERLRD